MNEYKYTFNSSLQEIFPADITNNKIIVYHGTCNFYAAQIEKEGFKKGYCPIDKKLAQDLVALLKTLPLRPYDMAPGAVIALSSQIEQYLHYIDHGIRISFSPLSSKAAYFAVGYKKGGQILEKIRIAESSIKSCIEELTDSSEKNSTNQAFSLLQPLFNQANEVLKGQGIVYAVQLHPTLAGIEIDANIIYSTLDIPSSQIVGKVLLPEGTDILTLDKNLCDKRIREKLDLSGGIRNTIFKRDFKIDPNSH